MNGLALDMFRQKAKENGLKITPQRTAIFLELLKATDHPAAEVIYKRIVKKIPNISFDTVNRTVSTFSEVGLIKVVEGYGQAKRYDPDLGLHHHFRCVRCGRIIDFHNRDYDNLAVPPEINKRFTVTGKKVVLEGLCGECGKD
jgi:Fur family transcriptional regulator, peroxide stress response regulator